MVLTLSGGCASLLLSPVRLDIQLVSMLLTMEKFQGWEVHSRLNLTAVE